MTFIYVLMHLEEAKSFQRKLNVADFQRKHKAKYTLNVKFIEKGNYSNPNKNKFQKTVSVLVFEK